VTEYPTIWSLEGTWQ